MKFELLILGSGSSLPTLYRNPSSQLLNIRDQLFLIDCAEGTQLQLRKHKVKFQRIHNIFISHLHGDHYFGLMGLLSSMHLLGRTQPLALYAPQGLQQVIALHFQLSKTMLNYPLNFIEVDTTQEKTLYEDQWVSVSSIPLKHRIPCCGYLFEEKLQPRKIIKEKLEGLNVSLSDLPKLKTGEDLILEDGRVIQNEELTMDPPAPRSFAYCSDTSYFERIVTQIKGVDLLYHEATFLEEMKTKAKDTFHSTAQQAAQIADKAMAQKLVLGHFSSRYRDVSPFLAEAQSIFPNTHLAEDGKTFSLD